MAPPKAIAVLAVPEPGPVNWHPLIPAAERFPAEKLKVTAIAVTAVKFRFVAPAVGQSNLAGLPFVVMRIPEVELDV